MHQLREVVATSQLVLEHSLLVEHVTHQLHADAVLLLVVAVWARVLLRLRLQLRYGCFIAHGAGRSPRVRWGLRLGERGGWFVGTGADSGTIVPWRRGLILLLARRLLDTSDLQLLQAVRLVSRRARAALMRPSHVGVLRVTPILSADRRCSAALAGANRVLHRVTAGVGTTVWRKGAALPVVNVRASLADASASGRAGNNADRLLVHAALQGLTYDRGLGASLLVELGRREFVAVRADQHGQYTSWNAERSSVNTHVHHVLRLVLGRDDGAATRSLGGILRGVLLAESVLVLSTRPDVAVI